MTVGSIETVFIEELKEMYGRDEAGSIAWIVIGFVCKINRSQYLSNKDMKVNEDALSALYKLLIDLKKGIPVQYALGETEFYGSVFKVNSSVLIPRPETEELVDWILKDIKKARHTASGLTILDIGTGSGCIPITLQKYLANSNVSAIDISEAALETARENAMLNDTVINFIQDDIFYPRDSYSKYLIITSNPPYVTFAEKTYMHKNVVDFEPHVALFVPNDDALVFYDAIAEFAIQHLESNGALYLEINEHLGPQTVALLKSKGFANVELRKDLRDKDRMIKAQLI